jgi:uncharacterized Zn finger protein
VNFQDFGRPVRVDGGLRARSSRGAIGKSWWSRRFLDVLESFALGSRLTRGRSYARAGQVLSLEIKPGTVTASVQGSRPKPYRVTIGLAPFPALIWAKVEVTLAEQALYSARLLAGELPPELEQVFADVGTPLFPAELRDLDLACSCPDWQVPCKHLAATFYLLAESFDADPFQILRWRGRDREGLLSRLRELRAADPGSSADPGSPVATPRRATPSTVEPAGTVAGAGLALSDVVSAPLAESLDRFWLPPLALPARPPTLDTEPDFLLRQLPPPGPTIGGPGLVQQLRPAYARFAAPPPAE